MKINFSLKQIWTSIILFAILVPVTIVMIWYGSTMYQHELKNALKIERLTNEGLRNNIEFEVKRFKTLLKNKSDPISFLLDAKSKEASKKIDSLLALIVNREPAVHGLMLVSPQGQVITAVDPGINIFGDKILSANEIRLVGEHWRINRNKNAPEIVIPSFGRIYISSLLHHENELVFIMAVPVGRPVKAILLAEFNAEKFLEAKEHKLSTEKNINYVLDQRGALITKVAGSQYNKEDLMTHLAIARSALIKHDWHEEVAYNGVLNQPVFGTLTRIPSLGWAVISEVAVSKVNQPILTSLFKIFSWTVVGIVIFIWLVLRLVDNTLKPIQKANAAIDSIASGNYNFKLESCDIKELDNMISGISHMTKARQQAELKLQDKEKEQREILDSMVDAVISIDDEGKIQRFNHAAEVLYGYSSKEIAGKSIELLLPHVFTGEYEDYLKNYSSTDESSLSGFGREVMGKRKNNEIFPVRLIIAPLPATNEGKQRFICSCIDLTDTKQKEEQLRRSQKMEALGKLTGGIAHDYNNMLGVILGYTEMLETMLDEKSELKNYTYEIMHAGERGAKLTKKLLSFSRQKSSDAEAVNINNVLLGEQHMLEKTLTARIKLIFDLDDDIWMVNLDEAEFEDAIVNMSINAMHAIEGQGELIIQTHNEKLSELEAATLQLKPGEYVLLNISDSGKGMEESVREKIFEPFYSTKGELGTGLGLSQVYGFVERSRGAIKVASEVGKGSRLTLYFPRCCEQDLQSKDKSVIDDAGDLTGSETILVVDDEASLKILTSKLLEKQGYQVYCAESGKEALTILEKEKIDLLLSDVVMPEMDGFQLAAIVQKKYPSIKIQLASGFSDERHISMQDNTLYKNMLEKPYQSVSLLRKIRDLLD